MNWPEIVGAVLAAVFTGGMTFWAQSIHGHVRNIDSKMTTLASWQGRMDQIAKDMERRLVRIEDASIHPINRSAP